MKIGEKKLFILAILISLGVFALDAVTPSGVSLWVMYVGPLLVVSELVQPLYLLVVATLCSVLMLAGIHFSLPGDIWQEELLSRLTGIGTAWVLVIVLLQRNRIGERLKENERYLERQVEERRHLAAAVEYAAEGVLIMDASFIIRYANPAFFLMTGYTAQDLVGKNVRLLRGERDPEELYKELRATLQAGKIWAKVYPLRHKSGAVAPVKTHISSIKDVSGVITHYVVLCHDMTEQLRLEEQLRQAQKMEAIGTLAGGIAHDFNNILAAIIGHSELILEDVSETSDMRSSLERILAAGIRGRDLVRQILTFSRKSEGERKGMQMTPVVKETFKLLRASLPATVEMSLRLDTNDDSVLADPTQIQQLLMNLATNAAYAMREQGGILEIGLKKVDLEQKELPDNDVSPGPYLILSVKDTGCGMSSKIRKRIFEPFFTTKEPGRGTGMGLAVVYGIVKSHGGAITVASSPKRGSEFQIFLPSIGPIREEEVEEEVITAAPGGNERILFVDDEEPVAEAAGAMLSRLGYQVTALTDPIDALERFFHNPARYDLIITDQTMPKMTGVMLAEKVLRATNGVPIILCTGYSDTVSADKVRDAGISEFLMKPIEKRELAEAIRRTLDGEDSEQ